MSARAAKLGEQIQKWSAEKVPRTMIVTQAIADQTLLLECDSGLESAAREVLRTFADLAGSGKPMRDGFRIRFGWSLLTLRSDPAGLRVCEPLFTGDPDHALNPNLDTTLGVLKAQVEWLQRLGEQGSDVAFDQQIVVVGDALATADIFALQEEPKSDVDSGWSVAPVPAAGHDIDMSGLRALPIHLLVAARPGLLPILVLPTGYLVSLRQNEVIEVEALSGRIGWQAPRSSDRRR